jgi:molybdopterin-synthase adenylyltransferase
MTHQGRWQDRPDLLRGCDIVLGCVDSFAERRELEATCRRYLIPYVDIGMDVHQVDDEPPRMAGQVILSMPGAPCMFCLGFGNEERLAQEARKYGATGPRPQVVGQRHPRV